MSFELIPNEIVIECFEYLEVFDLFHSFDQLNHRFNQLIRTIPLRLNYQHAQKLLFDKFCMKILSEPEIKSQIYSIQISNENSCDQIERFLSSFSLNDFPYLHGLSLTKVTEQHVTKLESVLPLLTNLTDFRLINSNCNNQQLISLVPISKLQRLSVRNLSDTSELLSQPCAITHLTLSQCHLHDLCEVLRNVPLLKYLNIKNMPSGNSTDPLPTFPPPIHLKRLILTNYHCIFDAFELFISQMSNLKYLTITNNYNEELINAPRWEHLISRITSSIETFQF